LKSISIVTGLLCSISVQLLFAQSALVPAEAVSFYQLSYKPDKQARRLFEMGSTQLKRRDFPASLKLFQQAVAIDSKFWAAQNNLGYTYLHLAQRDRAERAFERAVEIDPLNPIGYANISVAALYCSDYRKAEQSARKALRLNPQLAEAKALLGLAQVGQGNWSPEAHNMLEQGYQYVPGAERILRKWPAPIQKNRD
jgi:Flp pilus assembly protein TadD